MKKDSHERLERGVYTAKKWIVVLRSGKGYYSFNAPTEWAWSVFSTSQISITANVPHVPGLASLTVFLTSLY